jgi:hypothetical protein
MHRIIETPAARNSDPETSHLAASDITSSGVRGHQQRQVIAAVRAFPGCTSFELAMKTKLDRYVVARRLSECVTADEVKKGEPKACPITGKQALTWWPKEVAA